MLKKTIEKIERRFNSLPLHHIDTSIILEPEKTIDGKFCRRYIQKVGYNYKGILSFPTLGEISLSLLKLDDDESHFLLDVILGYINSRKICFYVPKNTHQISLKIRELDTRLDLVDVDIVSCAIEHKAVNLVTLDRDLIENNRIEEEFGLKILHPKDLL